MTRIAQWLAISLFLYLTIVLSLNYSLLPYTPSHDQRRIIELLLIILILLWHILTGLSSMPACPPWQINSLYLIAVFLALAGASALLSASPIHAVQESCIFAGLFYIAGFTAILWQHHRRIMLQGLVYAILLGAAIYMVGFYIGYLASFLENMPLKWPEPFFGFANIRAFNQYQLWTLALLCLPLLAFDISKSAVRRWLLVILTAWWVLFFASASRGVLLAWFVAMLATYGIYRRLAWPLLRLQLGGFIAGLGFYGLLFRYLLPSVQAGAAISTVARNQTEDRLYLWEQAWLMIKTHPGSGWGPCIMPGIPTPWPRIRITACCNWPSSGACQPLCCCWR